MSAVFSRSAPMEPDKQAASNAAVRRWKRSFAIWQVQESELYLRWAATCLLYPCVSSPPDPHDESISKRSWESQMAAWRSSLREWAAAEDAPAMGGSSQEHEADSVAESSAMGLPIHKRKQESDGKAGGEMWRKAVRERMLWETYCAFNPPPDGWWSAESSSGSGEEDDEEKGGGAR